MNASQDGVALLRNKTRVIYLSVAAAVLTIGIKLAAFLITGSVGLLSDALESGVNLAAALLAAIMLSYAARPADRTHAYGHDKAEYFSSGVEGTLIILAAVGIVYAAVKRFLHPVALQAIPLGAAVALSASGINFLVARWLLRAAKEHDSITLEADARHLMTDVWTSLGVVLGLALVALTGFTWLDPVIACLVGVHIVFSGIDLVLRSFRGLMDHALPESEVESIRAILARHAGEVRHYHNLRTRKSGPNRFIDLHILVPGDCTVQHAHDLCETLEKEIETALTNTQVTIHVEPVEDAASWNDGNRPPSAGV